MQPLKPPRTETEQRRMDVRWGIVGLVAVLVMAAAVGVVSTVKFDETSYTAYLADAGALRPGDEVRMAGITVGSVKSLDLRATAVEMTFTVSDDLFLGAQTTLDVRMLTIVGGHYVAVLPAGSTPLGRTPISADRVTLPYNLSRAFQDAIAPVREIDGTVLRQNFAALTGAVDSSPEGFRRLVGAVGSIVDILDRQNADVSRSLQFTDEYLGALAQNKAVVGRLIEKFRLLETIVEDEQLVVGEALRNLALVLGQVAPIAREWTTELAPMVQPITDAMPALEELAARLGTLLDSIRGFGQRVQALSTPEGAVSIDQSQSTITAPALCIPVPGRTC